MVTKKTLEKNNSKYMLQLTSTTGIETFSMFFRLTGGTGDGVGCKIKNEKKIRKKNQEKNKKKKKEKKTLIKRTLVSGEDIIFCYILPV